MPVHLGLRAQRMFEIRGKTDPHRCTTATEMHQSIFLITRGMAFHAALYAAPSRTTPSDDDNYTRRSCNGLHRAAWVNSKSAAAYQSAPKNMARTSIPHALICDFARAPPTLGCPLARRSTNGFFLFQQSTAQLIDYPRALLN